MRRHSIFAVAALLAALTATAAAQPKPPAEADDPTKPYKPVAITLPASVSDPGLAALRKQIGEAVKKRDRAALGKLIVNDTFFWEREGASNSADKKKPGVENLSVALGLGNKDAPGWDMLNGYSEDPTASPSHVHPGAVCAPADPGFNGKDMDALLDSTQTDIAEWGYPVADGVPVRDAPQASAPASGKLGMHFVRVVPDANPAAAVGSFIRIVTPAGKYGYVATDDIAPLGNDQLCYVKDGGEWKIGGYVGAGDAQ
jgi:hypothetical protein